MNVEVKVESFFNMFKTLTAEDENKDDENKDGDDDDDAGGMGDDI